MFSQFLRHFWWLPLLKICVIFRKFIKATVKMHSQHNLTSNSQNPWHINYEMNTAMESGFSLLEVRLPLVGPTPPLNAQCDAHLYSMWWMNYTNTMKWFYEIHLIYNWIMRYTGWGTVTESTTVGGTVPVPQSPPCIKPKSNFKSTYFALHDPVHL